MGYKCSEYEVLELVSFVGKLYLKNGAEVYKTEEIICNVGQHFGYTVETFSTLTCTANNTASNTPISKAVLRNEDCRMLVLDNSSKTSTSFLGRGSKARKKEVSTLANGSHVSSDVHLQSE